MRVVNARRRENWLAQMPFGRTGYLPSLDEGILNATYTSCIDDFADDVGKDMPIYGFS